MESGNDCVIMVTVDVCIACFGFVTSDYLFFAKNL